MSDKLLTPIEIGLTAAIVAIEANEPEVLVAQGAASFELWTGQPAPVEAMRRAVGLT